MKRNNGKQYENNGEEMKTHCLPRLMHAGKCACQLHLPLFSRLLLLPRRVSSLSLTPHFPPIVPPSSSLSLRFTDRTFHFHLFSPPEP